MQVNKDDEGTLVNKSHLDKIDASINIGRLELSRSNLSDYQVLPVPPPKNKFNRKVYLDGHDAPLTLNYTINSKYNIITFLPLVLFQQFRYFFNLYFLGLTVTQFLPALKVGFLINYIGPLSLVLTLSILKEAYDDILRHARDQAINNQEYTVLTKSGPAPIRCKQLRVGMIVQIKANDRIPADLLVLSSSDADGHTFIRTDQLDGETDWKLRKAVKLTHPQTDSLIEMRACCKCEPPSASIYSFKGKISVEREEGKVREALSLENVIWASTVLACNPIWGLVIYCGKDTRISLNSKLPTSKIGKFDREMDTLAKMLFMIMVLLTSVVTFFSEPVLDIRGISVSFIRYLVLLSNIIPISMRVNLEFAKLVYSIRINRDKQIEGALARNSCIPEELGRINYLLTDKTGTLTQNEMSFRKLSLIQNSYSYEQIATISSDLRRVSQEFDNKRKNHSQVLRELVTCLAVCHNVTPVYEYDDDGGKSFQASSPDEVALVKFVEEIGYKIVKRDQSTLVIEVDNQRQEYKILNNFPFSSESKRMGIIVRQGEDITFFVKGADVAIKDLILEQYRAFVLEECETLALDGLRTLVCASRSLTLHEYNAWSKEYEEANCKLANREEMVARVIAKLERKMEFLGITGVLDKLQEDAQLTVDNLRQAGIKVWMLTGDKLETAICTSIACGIKAPNQEVTMIRDVTDELHIQDLLLHINPQKLLVIDGVSLQVALDHHEELFFQMAGRAQSVVCCRCAPTQKARVALSLRKYSRQVVACIGDGGNDVGMIQSSDVGIGIEGKEGKQAALASDFSILQFKHLNQLLLWHGRLSYKRSALLSQFIIHRGLLIASVQAVFMFLFYFLSISVFSGPLMLGYSTLFTMFPVFCIIFDEDVNNRTAMRYPPLYATLQKGRQLNAKTFLIWLWKAVYQGFMIITLSMFLIENAFLKIETTAFTCLIFTQYLMLLTELNSLHIVMIFMVIVSLAVYVMVMLLFRQQLMVITMTWTFTGWVLVIMLISWCPLFLARVVMNYLDPSDFEKLMRNVKRDRIRVDI